jgi:ZIP family zinc transporter
MSGLLLGIIGGAAAGGTSVLGALTTLFQSNTLIADEKSIEQKLGILLGFLLLLASFSYINPTLKTMYHGGFASDYELWSVIAAFIAGPLLMLLFTEVAKEKIAGDEMKRENVQLILLVLLRNIPEGMAAGAAMNVDHSGLSYSLLSFIIMHQLFQGIIVSLSLMGLGLEAELTFVGSMFIGFVVIISGIFGSVVSQESFTLIPVMMAFAGGSMMSAPLSRIIENEKDGPRKLVLNSSLFSGIIVTLFFIIWKEFA